ncbi:MAG: hypothetical protein EOP01_05130, partial [Propionibacteriaceae bacterium]
MRAVAADELDAARAGLVLGDHAPRELRTAPDRGHRVGGGAAQAGADVRRDAHQLADDGSHEGLERHEGADGVAREHDDRRAVLADQPEALRLARLHRDRREVGGAQLRHDGLDDVVVALAHPAGGDDQVGADELVVDELLERLVLSPEQIYDSNSYLIAAAAKDAGAQVFRVGHVGDDPAALKQLVYDQLVRADLIVTTGGVSQGDYDIVKAVLPELGATDFAGVAMQPGKPQGFGLIGEDRTPIVMLPGNPVSAFVSFEAFVRPVIRKLMGITPYVRPGVRATAAHA